MKAAAPGRVNSEEHDGITIVRGARGERWLEEMEAAVGAPLAVKAAPVDPVAYLQGKFSEDDWSVQASMSTAEFAAKRNQVQRALESGPKAVVAIDAVVAELLAAMLQGVCTAPRGGERKVFERYMHREGRWGTFPKEDLAVLIMRALPSLATYDYSYVRGKMRAWDVDVGASVRSESAENLSGSC